MSNSLSFRKETIQHSSSTSTIPSTQVDVTRDSKFDGGANDPKAPITTILTTIYP